MSKISDKTGKLL